jgi:hypothetical protein
MSPAPMTPEQWAEVLARLDALTARIRRLEDESALAIRAGRQS